jgi:hypothetical protein
LPLKLRRYSFSRHTLRAMLPDRGYLALIGELAYRVSYLEWLVIGDLGNVLPRPAGIDAPSLLGKSTGQIAGAVAGAAQGWKTNPNSSDSATWLPRL